MAVGVGGGSVWATAAELGAVVRIDPATNKVTATIKLPWLESGQPCGFVVADEARGLAGGRPLRHLVRLQRRHADRPGARTSPRSR